MTPIFNLVYKAQNQKGHNRSFIDEVGLLDDLKRIHTLCFDMTEVQDAVSDIAGLLTDFYSDDKDYFLLRTRLPSAGAFFEFDKFGLFVYGGHNDRDYEGIYIQPVTIDGALDIDKRLELKTNIRRFAETAYACLWLINVPNHIKFTRVASKRKHRKSATSAPWMNGGYTKVNLCINGKTINANTASDRHGMRPYHFVRGHIRKICQQEIYIRPHWRGNKEIGIKHHQYHCVIAQS